MSHYKLTVLLSNHDRYTVLCVFCKRLHTCTLRFFCNALRRYIIFLCQHPNHSCCSLGSDAVVDDVIACTLVSIAGYYNLCLCVLVQEVNLLFPQIGEIIGGSVREESYDKLMGEIEARNIPMKDMNWYLDTRKYGSCPHAGFGLGFERLILFVTGMQNIRDVIPFPRTPKNAEF